MKVLEKVLKDRKCLVFLDLEATQFTHEVIEIGAYKTLLRDDGTIKKVFKPFKSYVKAKSKVGKYVTELTGITDAKLAKEGVAFRVALQSFKKYVGKDFNKCLFVTFSDSDKNIFLASSDNNLDANREDALLVIHHMWDYCKFIHQFIQTEIGNPYSLVNYLKLFNVPFDGKAHDAAADAYNLIKLYKAFYEKKDIVEKEYQLTITRNNKMPAPILKLMRRIAEGETVSSEDLKKEISECLK